MVHHFGSELIYESILSFSTDPIIKEVYKLQDSNQGQYTGERNRSNRFGFQSYEYFYKKHKTHLFFELSSIFDRILEFVNNDIDNRFNHIINNYWFNINYPGSFNELHNHDLPQTQVKGTSGVIYVKVPDNSGNIIFENENSLLEIQPCTGKLLLFPSHILHKVSKNNSDSDRISIAFNLEGKVIESKRQLL